jgi:quercetin dioxygenase-like cupin family protein
MLAASAAYIVNVANSAREGSSHGQVRGEEVRILNPGDTAIAPAEEWHGHGAATDAMMTMISVQGADADGAVVHWGPAVDSEAEA